MDGKLAVRAVIYNEQQGGYIDNVPSTFTRSNEDLGNFYFNIHAQRRRHLPQRPAGRLATGLCTLPIARAPQANNFADRTEGFQSGDLYRAAVFRRSTRSTTTGTS